MTTAEHPEWGAFMAAIVANPGDDTVRLVAADFLEENGDPDRAAFIRIQVQLARLEFDGQDKSLEADQLRAKERAFLGPLSMFRLLWAAEACPELVKMPNQGSGRAPLEATTVQGAERIVWWRGFVIAVNCSPQEWQRHGLAIRKRQPVQVVNLTDCGILTVPDWLALLPSLRGLGLVNAQRLTDWDRVLWLRSQLPGVQVNNGASR